MVGDDELVALNHTCALYESLPAGQLCVVPRASHALPLEYPDETAAPGASTSWGLTSHRTRSCQFGVSEKQPRRSQQVNHRNGTFAANRARQSLT